MIGRPWEVYLDPGYFDMWAVRPVDDTAFNSPQLFHFVHHEDALAFRELAERAVSSAKAETP